MVFPGVMYRCESWTIKKAQHCRINAFELWCWRRLLKFPWTARRSNQSILKEINPEYSLEGLMPKLQAFGHLMQRADSLGKTLMLGKIGGRRRSGRQRMIWLDGITDWMGVESEWTAGVGDVIQPFHPLLSPSPFVCVSQHQHLFNKLTLHIRGPKY